MAQSTAASATPTSIRLTGHEFSAVPALPTISKIPRTNYKNGVDLHLDWGASQFLTKQIFVGPVGYVYNEVGCDSGSGDRVGCFQSQVVGIGPQIGSSFRSAICRATSISRATRNSPPRTGPMAGMPGLHS